VKLLERDRRVLSALHARKEESGPQPVPTR